METIDLTKLTPKEQKEFRRKLLELLKDDTETAKAFIFFTTLLHLARYLHLEYGKTISQILSDKEKEG